MPRLRGTDPPCPAFTGDPLQGIRFSQHRLRHALGEQGQAGRGCREGVRGLVRLFRRGFLLFRLLRFRFFIRLFGFIVFFGIVFRRWQVREEGFARQQRIVGLAPPA